MGLDMYCIRIKKLSEKNLAEIKGKTYEEISQMGYSIWTIDKHNKYLVEDAIPYLTRVLIKSTKFNYAKLKRDKHIPLNARETGFSSSSNGMGFTYRLKGKTYTAHITTSEAENYYIPIKTFVYVCKTKEIGYWRKEYNLQDAIYDACDTQIENCGYYKVNEEMEYLMTHNENGYPCPTKHDFDKHRNDPRYGYFYHEWY